MNSTLFIQNVIKLIKHYDCFIEAKHDRKKFYIHYDNCPSQRSKMVKSYLARKKFTVFPHPRYSPDLSPSDFYLFGTLKDKIEGIEFENEIEIENKILSEFQKISHSELKSVFDNWIKRCETCIANGGSYIE